MKQTPAFGIWIVLDQDELFFRRAEKSKIGFKKGFGSESPAQTSAGHSGRKVVEDLRPSAGLKRGVGPGERARPTF